MSSSRARRGKRGGGLVSRMPMVSCVMPTADRTDFVRQSIRCFLRQDYPERELIIVDDGKAELPAPAPEDACIRYLRVPAGLSVPQKRNYGCEQARGELLAHWDDDDWFASERLSYQLGPLLSGTADATGLVPGLFLDLTSWVFWNCTPELEGRLFRHGIDARTLVFRRSVWERAGGYPEEWPGEAFLERLLSVGVNLAKLPNEGLFLCVRHRRSQSRLACGRELDPTGWHKAAEPRLPAEDRAFLQRQRPAVCAATGGQPPRKQRGRTRHCPLVSCIMPTAGRRRFVPHAIRRFLEQDYPQRELVIIDDGDAPASDLMPGDPSVRYYRISEKRTVGAKRNLACEQARGEIVLHWDDDDWSAPWRISYQVEQLLKQRADVCGIDRVYFLGPGADQAWLYEYPPEERPWLHGGSLCYTRALWEGNHFADVNVGEDNEFLWNGCEKKVARLPDNTFYVALVHGDNVSPKATWDSRWTARPAAELRQLIGADAEIYASLAAGETATVAVARGNGKPRALVALGAGIGDILRATPLIRVFDGLGYEVDVLLEMDFPETACVLEGAPEISHLFYYTSGWCRTEQHRERLEGLAGTVYEVAAFPPWSGRTVGLVQTRSRLMLDEREWWDRGVSYAIAHIAENAGWQGAVPPPLAVPSQRRFALPPDTVALHPGCKPEWYWKKWHGFDELADMLPAVAIVGVPSDLDNGQTYFRRPFRWPGRALNFVGQLSLADTAALISQSRALVSNDSGLMHLGAAVGVPTIGIFGITSPAREATLAPNMFPLTKQLPCEAACRAYPYARTDCDYHMRCLQTLTAREVLARLESLAPPRHVALPPSSGRVGAAAQRRPPVPVPADWYDAAYFETGVKSNWPHGCQWPALEGGTRDLARFLAAELDAVTFLDAGCARGFLVRCLREAGKQCWGFDHSSWAVEHADEVARPFLELAGTDDFEFHQTFDVLLALDFFSHLDQQQALSFLVRARPWIQGCVLASIPTVGDESWEGDRDLSRVTVRDRQWWHELFLRAGWRQDFLHKRVLRNWQREWKAVESGSLYLYAP